MVEIERLRNLAHFEGLDDEELEAIRPYFFERTAERNDVLIFEDEQAEAIYFIMSGAAKAQKTSSEGKEQILDILRPGDSFNDVAVLDGRPSPSGVVAMSKVHLYGIQKADIEALIWNYPVIATNIIRLLAGKVRRFISLVEDLSFRHVTSRVAKLLLEHALGQTAQPGAGQGPPRLTQQDMAGIVGTSREVVGRSLRTLEEEGAIKVDRHRIAIIDRKVLEEISGSED